MQNSNFRYDINGLRAYAVVLVVLFHFGILGFSAGFIGVDIFFVISGFLMTSIVIKSLEKGNFSLLNFYLSRGIRIVPALLVVSIILLILGWFFLLPPDYRALGKHTFSSINFFSNLIYWKESGYFDTSSHNKALLHTWSLSVEWQFYLVFPILVGLLYKLKKSKLFLFIVFIFATIISFISSIIITSQYPSVGFFFLPTRAWEMLAGGLIFFIPQEKIPYKKSLEFIGFLLIAISCYIFSTNTLWPSYNAILPVLGAFLILVAHQQNSIFTKGSIFQWLGNNSYSIYLWHWPIVFFLYYFYKNNDYIFIISGVVLSIILGWLSYTYIENPTRKYLSKLNKIKAYSIWIIFVVLISTISLVIYKMDGVENRFSKEIQNILNFTNDMNPRIEECLQDKWGSIINTCTYGNGPVSLVVIGDSHASAMLNGVISSIPKDTSLMSITYRGCQTVENIKYINRKDIECGKQVKLIIDFIKKENINAPILIINRANIIFKGQPEYDPKDIPIRYINTPFNSYDNNYYQEMRDAYISTLNKFAEKNQVYITRPIPESNFSIPEKLAKVIEYKLPDSDLKISWNQYMDRSDQTWKAQDLAEKSNPNIHVINLTSVFCDNQYCHFTKRKLPLLHDDDHMSWTASLSLTPILKKEIFGN